MRTRSESDQPLSTLVNTALERGIIDASQRERLLSLARELSSDSLSFNEPDTDAASTEKPSAEARGGFNAITVAYSLGAMLVLFALGWFLVDRWRSLGPIGVFAVSALYAIAFAACAITLLSRGFRIAGGLASMLAVAMTPVWTWAMLRLTGLWPDPYDVNDSLSRYQPYLASRAIILDLATIGVALAVVRRVRFAALGAPLAIAFVALLVHLGVSLGDPRLAWYTGPYYQVVVACATLAVAYAVDRRQPRREDYAFWFYLGAVVMLFAGYVQVWSHIGAWRHALPLVAASLVAAALYLRRRTLVIAGGVAAFGYLGYLAFDVFRRVVALPVALAALGLLVIVATVWMQRRFPTLVSRVSREDDSGAKALPTGAFAVLGPLAIAITTLLFATGRARQETADRDWRNTYYERRARRDTRAQRQAERARVAPAPVVPDSAPRPASR